MSAGVIVLARFDSRRLRGKALLDIAGRPLLGHVLDRTRCIRMNATIIVATTDRPIDDPIADFACNEGFFVFRGDANDVARRCLRCAETFHLARFARVSGDSPFFDPDLVDRCFGLHERERLDVVTNVMPRTYPPGASTEIVARDALSRLIEETHDPDDREHVTRYFYRRPERFRIRNVAAPDGRYVGVRLTVDGPRDLDRAAWIVSRLPEPVARASLDDIVALARQWDKDNVPTPA